MEVVIIVLLSLNLVATLFSHGRQSVKLRRYADAHGELLQVAVPPKAGPEANTEIFGGNHAS